jgi:hypothetical protein
MQRSTNRFVDEQSAKRAEIERAKEEQLAKLKALNSPLPSGPPQGLVPEMPAYNRAPQKSPAQSVSSPMRGMSELQRLVNENDNTQEDTSDNNRQSYQPQYQNPVYNARTPTPPIPAERNAGSKRFSFNTNNFGRPDPQQNAPTSPPSPPPQQQQQQRKVVRQALPEVDEDDEFEAFARNGPNKHMSIGDALRNGGGENNGNRDDQESKSKMWGVDMSRFNK